MTAQTEDAPRTRQARATEATYTIQQRHEWDVEDPDAEDGVRAVPVWEDLVTVTVPARTKRPTVLKRGLADAGIQPPPVGTTLLFRVLDADSAHEEPVEADVQLRIGGAS